MCHHRNAKLRVEQCLRFDVGLLRRALRYVDSPNNLEGSCCWDTVTWSASSGQTKAVLGYWVGLSESEGLVVLTDRDRSAGFAAEVRLPGDYLIPITRTWPYIGGVRYWFKCPVEHNGKPCGRRVKKLYLPPGAQVFGCRECYALTYRSCQEHDKRKTALARDPKALDAALHSKDPRKASLGVDAWAQLGKWSRDGKTEQLAKVRV
jgi:hypothetical protein